MICSTVQDEVEEGEEADEDDVPSLLSLEGTNGGDHLLLGEVMIQFSYTRTTTLYSVTGSVSRVSILALLEACELASTSFVFILIFSWLKS